jgi:hypothetical protein
MATRILKGQSEKFEAGGIFGGDYIPAFVQGASLLLCPIFLIKMDNLSLKCDRFGLKYWHLNCLSKI